MQGEKFTNKTFLLSALPPGVQQTKYPWDSQVSLLADDVSE